jgi:hypothetical protein
MIIIAHRGNIDGPQPSKENSPHYIDRAILFGFQVEIDVWMINGNIYLGHDKHEHIVAISWLEKNKSHLWCHAKNISALIWLQDNNFHCFWHDKDDYTLTSENIVWAYPTSCITPECVYVVPEKDEKFSWEKASVAYGICTDYAIDFYKKFL